METRPTIAQASLEPGEAVPRNDWSRPAEGAVRSFVAEPTAGPERPRDRQQAAVARLGIYALKETDLQALFQEVTRQAAAVLGVAFCEVMELLPGGDGLLLRAGVGWDEGAVGSVVVEAGRQSQAGFTLEAGAPVVVEDLRAETRFRPSPLLTDHGAVSGVSVVLHGAARPYGVLGFHTALPRAFTEDEVHFVQSIANLLAAAVERHHAEQALRRSQRELQDFVDNATVGLHWVGPDGTILWVNQAELDLLGYTRDEYVGRNIAEFHADPAAIDDILSRLKGGETLLGYEARMRHRDGSIRHVLVSSNALRENGRFVHTRCFTRDITRQKQVEQALSENEARLRQILTVMPAGVYTCDAEGTITFFNPKAAELWGRTPTPGDTEERYCGSFHLYRLDGAPILRHETPMALAVHTGRPTRNQEAVVERPDGTTIVASVNIDPLFDESGRIVGAINVFFDVTEKKQLEEDLRHLSRSLEQRVAERTAALEQRNRELQDFAYVAGHDLREPLRKILTFTGLVLQEAGDRLGDVQTAYLERSEAAAGRMLHLLDDLLAYARVTMHAEPFSPVDLSAAVRDVLSDLEVRLRETEGSVDAGPLPTVVASPSQMRQLFQNLIGNALKFHRPGVPPHIRVYAEDQSGRPGDGCVRLFVEDNGVGFEAKYAERIFQPFQRLHGRGAYEGTGLGLAICRRIVERHGGAIAAEGTPGRGSRFTVMLPLQAADPHACGGAPD